MLPILGIVASAVGGIFKSWMEVKKVKAEGKISIASAKVQAKVKKIEQQGQMDVQSVNDMRFSWKDELLCLWFVAALTACFLPWTQPYMKEGFTFMAGNTPYWFEWSFIGIVAATFGLRTWMGAKKK